MFNLEAVSCQKKNLKMFYLRMGWDGWDEWDGWDGYRYSTSTFGANKPILQENLLLSGKNYTARKIITRRPVPTVVTNLKSDCSRPHSYPGEQRQDLLDGCRHVYLDMGTNAGVQT